MSRATEPCGECRDLTDTAVVQRTLAAYLRLLCTSCLREIVQLEPSHADARLDAGRAPRALQRLNDAATTELGRRILERDRVLNEGSGGRARRVRR